MLNIIKNLNATPSVSGREKAISDKILTYIAPLTDKVWEDAMGNLIAYKRGSGTDRKKIMLCAHMDEIGFMVTHIDDRGFIRIAQVGGINYVAAAYTYVVSEKGVRGVIVPEANTAPQDLKFDKVYITFTSTSLSLNHLIVSTASGRILSERVMIDTAFKPTGNLSP